jgi:nitrite reductase (cytochrome c-552)
VFPWDKGFTAQEQYEHYKTKPNGFVRDWVHPESGALMLKAQHPEFETWMSSAHGRAGVSCADCHMPYGIDKGQKYTTHWKGSPLRTVEASCLPCHRDQSKEWLVESVKSAQAKTGDLQRTAGQLVARAHEAIAAAAKAPNVNEAELANARELVREAQWYWDFVAMENSSGFHNAPLMIKTLGDSINTGYKALEAANKAANNPTL